MGPSKQHTFFCTLPQICSSRQSCLEGLQTIPLTLSLVCALTCTVNCGALYRQVCAFPNHVQSTEFTTGGLQLSYRNISRMISGHRMQLSSILSFMAKAVNTYEHVISFFILNTFAKKKKKTFFTLSLWGIVCRILWKKNNLIHFGKRL